MGYSFTEGWDRWRRTVRGWIDAALGHTHDHYFALLPGQKGVLINALLRLFYCGIRVGRAHTAVLRQLPADAVVVFTTPHKSYFEYLFYHTRYRQDGLRFPEIGLDHPVRLWQPLRRIGRITLAHLDHLVRFGHLPDPYASGYLRAELLAGRSAMVSLLEERGYYRRFVKSKPDPLAFLIDLQRGIERPVLLVPQMMFFTKRPARSRPRLGDMIFGSEQQPGNLRRLFTLFRNPGRVFVEISQPLDLRTFLQRPENRERPSDALARELRQGLLVQARRHRQSITGPTLKPIEEIKENILTRPRLRDFMAQHARKRDVPLQEVNRQADGYIDEIAARYNPNIVQLGARAVRWVLDAMFDGVTVNREMLSHLKAMAQRGPIVLVPCHKSHIDYLILSYILHQNDMPCPHVAAGKNLSFWPMGPFFRGGGAFFIRRTFKGAVLYSKVFAEYVYTLLEEGFNIEFFIEGGRSRTGKLILPKLGLLSILLNAFRNGACDDMIFAPIYIGYDQVLEEKSYLEEIEGGQKKPESLGQVLRARKFLRKRYGKIYIQFHAPISLNQLLAQNGQSLREMSSKEQNTLCRNLGYRIINAINQVTVITPQALVAAALLNMAKKRFSRQRLLAVVETYMTLLLAQKAKLSDTLLLNHMHAVEHVLDNYVQRKLIDRSDDAGNDVQFTVPQAKRPHLEYYKNNCISFFIPAAYTATAVLANDAFQFSSGDLHATYDFLQDLFKYEFAYDVDRSPEYYVRKTIKAFIDQAILMPHPTLPDTYNLTSAGFRKLNVFARFLKTYLESYMVVLRYFQRHANGQVDPKERLKKIQQIGNQMYKRREIEHSEALSKIYYENAVTWVTTTGLRSTTDPAAGDTHASQLHRFLNCL